VTITISELKAIYVLRNLRAHGLQGDHLHEVCKSYLQTRIGYAISAWSGFASCEDKTRLQRVINRVHRWGLDGGKSLPSVEEISEKSDRVLFASIKRNSSHVLHDLLPPERPMSSSLRERAHNYQLTSAISIARRSFMQRMLFKDAC